MNKQKLQFKQSTKTADKVCFKSQYSTQKTVNYKV